MGTPPPHTRQPLTERTHLASQTHGKAFEDIPVEFESREPRPQMEVPPPLPLGMGDEEDTIGSFLYLMPKPPAKDLKRMIQNDRWRGRERRRAAGLPPLSLSHPPHGALARGVRRKTMRFLARFESPSPEDADRQFVVSLFLVDNTISVFEKFVHNSGFVGGKFLERSRVRSRESGDFIEPGDLYVGARLNLNGFTFLLVQADEHSLALMEADPAQWPLSDAGYVLDSLRKSIATGTEARGRVDNAWAAADLGGALQGFVSYPAFQEAISGALSQAAHSELQDQALVTLMRAYHAEDEAAINYARLLRDIDA